MFSYQPEVLEQVFNSVRKYEENCSYNSTQGESPDQSIIYDDRKPLRLMSAQFDQNIKSENSFKKKIKTELCKNWELTGCCSFRDKCSFAHGIQDIQTKTHLHQNFKTSPCKSYFFKGFCPYGKRCQYIHSEILSINKFKDYLHRIYKEKNISIQHLSKKQRITFQQKLIFMEKVFNVQNDFEEFIQNTQIIEKQ